MACSNACVDCEVTAGGLEDLRRLRSAVSLTEFEEWNAWSSCSTSCGGGSQRRSRGILVHAQGEGVLRCPEKLEQIKASPLEID